MAPCEWVIDIIQEWVQAQLYATQAWVQAQGYLTTSFIDRGDPAGWDYTKDTLTLNNAWHPLDLSAIVPAGAKIVLMRAQIQHLNIGKFLWLREHGNVNTRNVILCVTQVGQNYNDLTAPVTCDADRKIDYKGSIPAWMNFNLLVRGWWL